MKPAPANTPTLAGLKYGDNQTSNPTLLTLLLLCELEPALTLGGVRHLLFTKGHNLPGVYRFGRKLLFDRAEFMAGIKEGHTAQISGRVAK
ncbi:hypothetical protein [Marinobacter sp. ELB17]|uniref:hypothetical protein n=1 Tax=Marinobacter sp. ELB17 TaxID=270374 RepID=UPI0000F380FA|nr:hypothetical protein [Marinobacter sp. ELB17]EBA00265.1 hypothetical protein MELB17_04077 [Marinobacter sp. ELB17]